MFKFLKNKLAFSKFKKAITRAFPDYLYDDVSTVLNLLSIESEAYNPSLCISSNFGQYKLLNDIEVRIPYRIYISDAIQDILLLSQTQQVIYHCIFSRSHNGYKRQKHIEAILENELTDWCMPFVLMISGEYVVEILNVLYDKLYQKNNDNLKAFCRRNLQTFLYTHARMISYWDCFYRAEWYNYNQYIGKKLFSECFGYTKSMEKICKKTKINISQIITHIQKA